MVYSKDIQPLMSADEALALAKYQLPGFRVVVGAEHGYVKKELAADEQPNWVKNSLGIKRRNEHPSYQQSWWTYDFWKVNGWLPSLLDMVWGKVMMEIVDRELTNDEWKWLHKSSLRDFCIAIREMKNDVQHSKQ